MPLVSDNSHRVPRTWQSVVHLALDAVTPRLVLPADPTRLRATIVHDSTPISLVWLTNTQAESLTTNATGLGFPLSVGYIARVIETNQEVWAICVTGDTATALRILTEHRS